jgi:hypothetical protein
MADILSKSRVRERRPRLWQQAPLVLAVLLLPALLWGRPEVRAQTVEVVGETIKPRLVERIKNGQTTKNEIILYFGEPQEVERTPEGTVFKYFSYKDAPPTVAKPERDPVMANENISNPFFLDENKNIKRVQEKKAGKVLRRSLIVRFKADGETVLSHEYKEY